ncbi:hypothetical protein CkaCkLH20_09010 [Colletotrichum karsti]|uniref:Transmembrane protein n=1 Tax=Colletotrichum karsti TaxID=1095194 RepID=A0A9P6I260_9PEZI|nr:uncharacterized protein CkaCkLH20_09010 [Colletotrichum karsti]KAF9873551.1 hypothetical protein CkaCkLH20_09010 [Colletotrichum karsti]
MAPVTTHVLDAFAEHLAPRSAAPAAAPPTKTLPLALREILARQVVVTVTPTPETTQESASNSSNLSGGAIAGIVIGSIAGFLILLWILKSCGVWGRPNTWGDRDDDAVDRRYRGRSPGSRHHRKHRHHAHHYHHETSRSRRRPSYEVNEVRYSQPVVYEKRRPSASPRPPAAVYRSSRSRTRY